MILLFVLASTYDLVREFEAEKRKLQETVASPGWNCYELREVISSLDEMIRFYGSGKVTARRDNTIDIRADSIDEYRRLKDRHNRLVDAWHIERKKIIESERRKNESLLKTFLEQKIQQFNEDIAKIQRNISQVVCISENTRLVRVGSDIVAGLRMDIAKIAGITIRNKEDLDMIMSSHSQKVSEWNNAIHAYNAACKAEMQEIERKTEEIKKRTEETKKRTAEMEQQVAALLRNPVQISAEGRDRIEREAERQRRAEIVEEIRTPQLHMDGPQLRARTVHDDRVQETRRGIAGLSAFVDNVKATAKAGPFSFFGLWGAPAAAENAERKYGAGDQQKSYALCVVQ